MGVFDSLDIMINGSESVESSSQTQTQTQGQSVFGSLQSTNEANQTGFSFGFNVDTAAKTADIKDGSYNVFVAKAKMRQAATGTGYLELTLKIFNHETLEGAKIEYRLYAEKGGVEFNQNDLIRLLELFQVPPTNFNSIFEVSQAFLFKSAFASVEWLENEYNGKSYKRLSVSNLELSTHAYTPTDKDIEFSKGNADNSLNDL